MSLRFLFATIGYPPFMGGAQTYVQQLAESLAAEGHQVTVVTTDAGEVEAIWSPYKAHLPAGTECCNGVTVQRVPLVYLPGTPAAFYLLRRLTVLLAELPGVPQSLLWRLAHYTPWLPGLKATLDKLGEPIDIVHGFTIPFESILEAAASYARARGTPFLATPFLHTGPITSQEVSRGYAMPHQLALLREARAVVALTEVERAFLIQRGVAADRIHVIPAGIPLSEETYEVAPAKAQHLTIVFLGAATYEKGALHLAEAQQRLWAEGLDIELVMLGTITDQFRRYYQGLPVARKERIQLKGVVSEEEKQSWLQRATLLALPSRVDSFGLAFLEAWAHRTPVIGADAGGIPAVIDDGVNGLLTPFGDVPALATAIRQLVQHPHQAAQLGQAGWEKLHTTYSWERVYPQLLGLYQQVLAA